MTRVDTSQDRALRGIAHAKGEGVPQFRGTSPEERSRRDGTQTHGARSRRYILSKMPAAPIPPPMHMVTMAY